MTVLFAQQKERNYFKLLKLYITGGLGEHLVILEEVNEFGTAFLIIISSRTKAFGTSILLTHSSNAIAYKLQL